LVTRDTTAKTGKTEERVGRRRGAATLARQISIDSSPKASPL